ncbi:DEAD/DEAH box helicase [Rhodococcus oxybenzonivorans]|uniref:DEAD/DEAH box helicase n=1 Tax=Rhodococcus oxybenzonivorans TaxID=1990687 RepID=A0AAE4UYG0_9NOCA|nr:MULTISPECIES: DEAD/DEAH box helicase [Rhodococcus]MDV7244974.1 DEAD/DEAH box helicase [Rhodococcus oxybenzonivorans]MDV7264901.1 DEAD/DEAH box helicase [Rhodococcus oxybenzonivorans]MDV7278208.1 DEAD/DEAH box helicase [Rhodococcus oxybenzonivorans]MDV7332304.1 DEAD/DEAH box helicase [Rhodococcus oxybenzonivorans]MDV7347865.1 DEAD/DEAH box helicase [Rhodococcus oxybenzonivorans]
MGTEAYLAQSEPARPAAGSLRAWQRRALAKYLSTGPRDFLAVATPGAGKTTFALRVASELLRDRTVDQVTVVAPTEHLKHQWAESATRNGIALDSYFSNSTGQTSSDYQGVVVTYAQVASHPFKHRVRTESRRTLVILDEIHHGGDAKSWGDAIREAFGDATRRLALTGTPFRSDDSAIPFVTYEPDREGLLRSKADHSYGYSDALADGVVRPVVFLAYSGEARWRNNAGEEFSARLGEPLSAEQTARAWRTALDPAGDWIPAVLHAADTRLGQLRAGGMPDAGGLVIATDQTVARAYAQTLTAVTGEEPVVVLSDDPTASKRIAEFGASTQKWMVAVRMVSEGVDVPRLAVGVYATSASTPLYFAQAIGRFVRSRRKGETASVFLPSVPVLLDLASQLEAQRDHVLGKPHREKEGFDDDLLADANKQKDELGEDEKAFTSIGADAELDQVIYDGSSFGTATFSGSDEEADYLGLPGLLDAEQMRALLRQRQQEQISKPEAPPVVAPPVPQVAERVAAAGQLAQLRRELNSLVAMHHHRTGKPHGTIHGELRRVCGGPPTAIATVEQLTDRIATLRQW